MPEAASFWADESLDIIPFKRFWGIDVKVQPLVMFLLFLGILPGSSCGGHADRRGRKNAAKQGNWYVQGFADKEGDGLEVLRMIVEHYNVVTPHQITLTVEEALRQPLPDREFCAFELEGRNDDSIEFAEWLQKSDYRCFARPPRTKKRDKKADGS